MITIKTVSGRQNPSVMLAASLKDKKKRDETGLIRFEGATLVRELMDRGRRAMTVFVTEEFERKNPELTERIKNELDLCDGEYITVTDSVYDKMTEQSSPDGILCICEKKEFPNIRFACGDNEYKDDAAFKRPCSRGILICEDMRDPGNLGTVIRSGGAFGTDGIFLCGCADVFSQKSIRAAMGASFTADIFVFPSVKEAVMTAKSMGYTVIATALHSDAEYVKYGSLPDRCAVMIGSEGSGLSDEAIALADKLAVIRTNMESLNAASAATLFMYLMSAPKDLF